MLNFLAHFIASGFYTGKSPVVSGTVGSFAALCSWCLLQKLNCLNTHLDELLLIAATIIIGQLATAHGLKHNLFPSSRKEHDPSIVVIDEWAGMFISLFAIPSGNLAAAIASFALFRFFDIIKPGPVGKAEKLPGALGIMLDDIIAGVFACLVVHVVVLPLQTQFWLH